MVNNSINYTTELEKVMGVFPYRGCQVKKWGEGYFVLDKFCINLEEMDMVIDASLQSLNKNISK